MKQTLPPKQQKGFALMDPERRLEVARAGGRKAHANGNAFEWSPAEAKAAARKSALTRAKRAKKDKK